MTLRKGTMIRQYDDRMLQSATADYYGGTRFYNFGYWTESTENQKEACENLLARLLEFIPRHQGAILDVACGLGATTEVLTRHYQEGSITAINVSETQIETCKSCCPGPRFLVMDATQLNFDDGSFDTLICVEAAFHFKTRETFLAEAFRVLKPGGRLVLSDILVRRWAICLHPGIPMENFVGNLEDYRRLYEQAGFESIHLEDATLQSWKRFSSQLVDWQRRRYRAGEISPRAYLRTQVRHKLARLSVLYYLLAAATKPQP